MSPAVSADRLRAPGLRAAAVLPALLVLVDTALLHEQGLEARTAVIAASWLYPLLVVPFAAVALAAAELAETAPDDRQRGRIFSRSLAICGVAAAPIAYLAYWSAPELATRFAGRTETALLMSDYLELRALGIAVTAMLYAAAVLQQQLGRSALYLGTMIAAAALHGLLAYGFIGGYWGLPYLETRGAAAAAVLAETGALLWLMSLTLAEGATERRYKLRAPGLSRADREVLAGLARGALRALPAILPGALLPFALILLHRAEGAAGILAGGVLWALFYAARAVQDLPLRGLLRFVPGVLLLGGLLAAASLLDQRILYPESADRAIRSAAVIAALAGLASRALEDESKPLFAWLELPLILLLATVLRGELGVSGIWWALLGVRGGRWMIRTSLRGGPPAI